MQLQYLIHDNHKVSITDKFKIYITYRTVKPYSESILTFKQFYLLAGIHMFCPNYKPDL